MSYLRMARIPLATYRLQLHAGFGFDSAAEVAEYVKNPDVKSGVNTIARAFALL